MRLYEELFYSLTDHMTKCDLRIACWIPKTTNAQSQYVKHFTSTAALDARTRLNVTSHVHRLSVSVTCTPRRFTSEFDSFPIKPYAFLASLLVKILFRFYCQTLYMCQKILFIFRVSLNKWSMEELQFGH
jgi:hypothetical protein